MTANLTKNEIVSSLHIEPVNTDEYNRNLVKQLASHHKEKFLECIRKERNFLHGKRCKSTFLVFYLLLLNKSTFIFSSPRRIPNTV